jgi:flagellar basal-body rod protein FlgB
MHQNLTLFRMAHAMASHAGTRQAVIAQNIANADTPGYRPVDVAPFRDLITKGTQVGMRATRPSHLHTGSTAGDPRIAAAPLTGQSSPNGNGVSIEEQMLNAVETKRQHDRALAIYKSTLGILRTSIGRR